jgi:nitrite reductase (NO-forming)
MSAVTTPFPARPRAHTATAVRSIRAATIMRLLFGVVWAIDAVLKWLPGYRNGYLSALEQTAQGQPAFLHGWFHFWISLSQKAPNLFVDLTAVTETCLAGVLLLGVARRFGYLAGAGYMFLVWAVGEGFGGPYTSGATDIGAGIIYSLLFLTLLALSPAARDERLSLDRALVRRLGWWRVVAEPHAADRRAG